MVDMLKPLQLLRRHATSRAHDLMGSVQIRCLASVPQDSREPIRTIAVPALGCGLGVDDAVAQLGRLRWPDDLPGHARRQKPIFGQPFEQRHPWHAQTTPRRLR